MTALPRVALVGADAPPELVLAAGALPVRLGRSTATTHALRTRAAELLGAVDPAAVELLAGVLADAPADDAGLLGIVCSRDREASLRVYYVLRELRASGEPLPPVHLVDVVHLERPATLAYDLAQLERLSDVLARWTGTDPRAALADAATVYVDLRRLLGGLERLRSTGRVSGAEAAELYAAAATEHPAEVTARLTDRLSEAAARQPDERPALFLTGSSPEGPGLHRLLEEQGWRVVGEDGDRGALALTVEVTAEAVQAEGLLALARAYRDRGPDSATASAAERAAYTAAAVGSVGAIAAFAHVRRHDDGPLWDLPALRERLAGLGVPLAVLRDQGANPDPDAILAATAALRVEPLAGANP